MPSNLSRINHQDRSLFIDVMCWTSFLEIDVIQQTRLAKQCSGIRIEHFRYGNDGFLTEEVFVLVLEYFSNNGTNIVYKT